MPLKITFRNAFRLLTLPVACLCAMMLFWPSYCHAQDASGQAAGLIPTPTAWRLTSETLKLPGGEKMGMVAGELLFDVNDNLRLGAATYGAVRGERGGFITLGLAGELRQRLGASWMGHAGLFAGAGGGRSASAAAPGLGLSGGGLMLRADAGLAYATTGYGNFGFGLSHVKFPSGEIGSTQPYLQYEYPFYSLPVPGWVASPPNSGCGDRDAIPPAANEFALVARGYKIPSSARLITGQPQHGNMQLLGAEWLSYLDGRRFLKLESEGAMGGQNNGYMQILAGGGYRLPLSQSSALKLHAAAGPAGGGGVDTGGGLLLDAGVSLQQILTGRTALELSVGEVRAPSGSFAARSAALKLNYQLGLPGTSSEAMSSCALSGFEAENFRVRLTNQTYFKAAPQWRSQFADQPVSNLGGQLDYFFSPRWFVTGQGLAAYAGKAGAFMTGQMGMGAQWPVSERWFLEGEALMGAAGGGGLAVGGGLVGQANASAGYRLSEFWSAMATAGRISALHGDFKANVVGLSLAYQFTGFLKQ